jgi:hypothetical protein
MIVQDLGDLERITIAGFTNQETKLLKEKRGVMVGSRVRRDANGTCSKQCYGRSGPFIGNPNRLYFKHYNTFFHTKT